MGFVMIGVLVLLFLAILLGFIQRGSRDRQAEIDDAEFEEKLSRERKNGTR